MGSLAIPSAKNFYTQILDSAQDKDKQQRSLRRAYAGALGIIAILSVTGHFLTAYITQNQRENAEITFTMTKMRSLTDVIVSRATTYKTSGNSFDEELLSRSIAELEKEHNKIARQGSKMINAIFHASPYFLSKKIESFVHVAGEFSSRQSTGQREEAAAILTILTEKISKLLAINLDMALENYHADVVKQIEDSFRVQFISVLIVLLVLCLEALFIFRPLVLRLGQYHGDLIKLALTDALTGLSNRRAFLHLAKATLDHFNRHHLPFALVLTDLDKFKNVNDTYGHKVGDIVLQHYSKIMTRSLRGHDAFGRIGGEEFAILLPMTPAKEALQIIERLRQNVADTPCIYTDKDGEKKALKYTSSFGLVTVSAGTWTLDSLFIQADENLYKAKDQGRNCVVVKEL